MVLAFLVLYRFRNMPHLVTDEEKLQRAQSDISRLNGQLASANTNGKMDSNIGAAQSVMTQLQADAQYTETVIRTYEGMIKMVEEDQRQLAKRALKGESSMLGAMISTGALATALEIAD